MYFVILVEVTQGERGDVSPFGDGMRVFSKNHRGESPPPARQTLATSTRISSHSRGTARTLSIAAESACICISRKQRKARHLESSRFLAFRFLLSAFRDHLTPLENRRS